MLTRDVMLDIFRNDQVYSDFENYINTNFLTYDEVAVKCETSKSVVEAWVKMGRLHDICIKSVHVIASKEVDELIKNFEK